MGGTGIFLILFLVVHVGLNACIWANDNGAMFNKAAYFMGKTVVPRILEIGLFVGFFIHIIQGYLLTVQNQQRRKIGYAVIYGNRGSKWYSRSMGILGTLILMFLVMHIYHFWTPSRFGGDWGIHELQLVNYPPDPRQYHNLYHEMMVVFQTPLIVALYVAGCISLAYHLAHGFQSAFKTMGVHNNRYVAMLRTTGYIFAVVVPLAFAMMPVSIYFGWIQEVLI